MRTAASLAMKVFIALVVAGTGAAHGPAWVQSPNVVQRTVKPSPAPFFEQCHAAHRTSSVDVRAQREKTYACTIDAAVQAGVLPAGQVRECSEEFATAGTGRQYKTLRCAHFKSQGPELDERQWRVLAEEVCLARSEMVGHRYQGANRQQCLIDALVAQRGAPSPARRAECAKDRDREFQCLLAAPR